MKFILASQSSRRKDILKKIGLEFDVIPSGFEENEEDLKGRDAHEIIKEFSRGKANDVAEKIKREKISGDEELIIIAADTVVIYDGKIIGKPKDEEDAIKMLSELSGKTHEVVSGVTIVKIAANKIVNSVTDKDITYVTFKKLSEYEIKKYVDTGEPLDKAGSYGAQDKGRLLVKEIKGNFYNVIGLPVNLLYRILKEEFEINLFNVI